jgi:hypothetical protein
MVELPADLGVDDLWPVRVRKADGLGGVRRSAQRVCTHMASSDRLTGGSGGGHGSGSLDLTGTDAADKPPTNLISGVSFSPGEGPCPSDESARAVIIRSFGLEDA